MNSLQLKAFLKKLLSTEIKRKDPFIKSIGHRGLLTLRFVDNIPVGNYSGLNHEHI